MQKCSKCEVKKSTENGQMFCCDTCNKYLCDACSDLTSSEIRCMQLKKRKLLFLCEECENGLRQIPMLIKQVNELQEEIVNIKKSINTGENNRIMEEDVIYEMMERQNRRKNIIVYNVKESAMNSRQERNTDDNNTLKNILKDMQINLNNIQSFRLGKFDVAKNRPLKVILSSNDEALYVLKNKTKINIPSIRIYGDQTKMQREYFLSVKQKLDELKAAGDNTKTIKYINNKPTIVNMSSLTQNNRKN